MEGDEILEEKELPLELIEVGDILKVSTNPDIPTQALELNDVLYNQGRARSNYTNRWRADQGTILRERSHDHWRISAC